MEDPKQRLVTSISIAELERRWKAVREMMRDRNYDYLVMRNDEEFLGGYVKWFTDIPAREWMFLALNRCQRKVLSGT